MYAGQPLLAGLDECGRWIDCRYLFGAEHGGQLPGQGARPTAHVESPLARAHICELDQLQREFATVSADMSVVYIRALKECVRCRCPAHGDPVSDSAHVRFKSLFSPVSERNRL
jgi:hypothetical protein